MQGVRTQHLNGLIGTVSAHKREGHPTFIHKPSNPEMPQLVVCVCFDDQVSSGQRSVLLEPRFLVPLGEAVQKVAGQLEALRGSM